MVWLAMGWALAKTVACLAKSLRGAEGCCLDGRSVSNRGDRCSLEEPGAAAGGWLPPCGAVVGGGVVPFGSVAPCAALGGVAPSLPFSSGFSGCGGGTVAAG